MQIKLRLNKKTKEAIIDELTEKKIEISEEAKLILTEEDYTGDSLECRDENGIIFVNTNSICYIESMGHDVFIHTNEKKYKTGIKLQIFLY